MQTFKVAAGRYPSGPTRSRDVEVVVADAKQLPFSNTSPSSSAASRLACARVHERPPTVLLARSGGHRECGSKRDQPFDLFEDVVGKCDIRGAGILTHVRVVAAAREG